MVLDHGKIIKVPFKCGDFFGDLRVFIKFHPPGRVTHIARIRYNNRNHNGRERRWLQLKYFRRFPTPAIRSPQSSRAANACFCRMFLFLFLLGNGWQSSEKPARGKQCWRSRFWGFFLQTCGCKAAVSRWTARRFRPANSCKRCVEISLFIFRKTARNFCSLRVPCANSSMTA